MNDSRGSTWQIVRRQLLAAPIAARRRIRLQVFGFFLVVAVAFVDAATGNPGFEMYRLLSIVLFGLALVFFVAGRTIQTAAAPNANTGVTAATERPAQLDHALEAVPALTLIAALLSAGASGLILIPTADAPVFVIALALLLAFTTVAARETIAVSRSLYREAEARTHAAERAEADAAAARFATLQAQVNPHFLFNALNTVASLVRTDAKAAEATVEHLARLLRRTLERSARAVASVRDEVDFLRAYLSLEQQRWGDALRVEMAIAPDTLSISIPAMTLQPLVENALKHGLGGRMEGGRVRVTAARDAEILTITVADDGVGLVAPTSGGTGLDNLRRRLQTLYGERAALTLAVADGWTVATVTVPVS